MKKKCTVVMLPTKQKQLNKYQLYKYNDIIYFSTSEIFPEDWTNHVLYPDVKPQYLYILLDDKIKEGDWVYAANSPFHTNENIFKWEKDYDNDLDSSDYKKIIATTDLSLTVINTDKCSYINCDDECKSTHIGLKYLPRPSNEFIQKFCRNNGIWEVMVEYKCNAPQGNCTANIITNYNESNCNGIPCYYFTPKVAPDNTITIYPIKDSWSREKVISIARLLYQEVERLHSSYRNLDIDKWLEENL